MSPAEHDAESPQDNVHTCGYPEDSFACKVRHISLQTGAANMKREDDIYRAKVNQVKHYGI